MTQATAIIIARQTEAAERARAEVRAVYAEIIDETEAVIECEYVRGVPSIAGRVGAADFGEVMIASYRRQEPVVIDDTDADPRLPAETRAAFRTIGAGANLGVGPVKRGRWVAAFAAQDAGPRQWTANDVALVRSVAERVWDAVEQARAEAALAGERERLAVAEALGAERQALLEAVVRAQEEERRHLARELHDEIGQALTGLQLQLAAFARGQNGRAAAREAEQIVRDLTARVSGLSVDMRPSALDTLGLLPALLSHVERYQARTGLRIDLRHTGLDRRFPPAVEITTYRVVQEIAALLARAAAEAPTRPQRGAPPPGWAGSIRVATRA